MLNVYFRLNQLEEQEQESSEATVSEPSSSGELQSGVVASADLTQASASILPKLLALALSDHPSLTHLEKVVEDQAKLLQEKNQQIKKLELTVESLQKTLPCINNASSGKDCVLFSRFSK